MPVMACVVRRDTNCGCWKVWRWTEMQLFLRDQPCMQQRCDCSIVEAATDSMQKIQVVDTSAFVYINNPCWSLYVEHCSLPQSLHQRNSIFPADEFRHHSGKLKYVYLLSGECRAFLLLNFTRQPSTVFPHSTLCCLLVSFVPSLHTQPQLRTLLFHPLV